MQLEKVEEKEFWNVFLNPTLNIFEIYWHRSSNGKEMKPEEFQTYLLHFVDLVKEYKVTGFLTNTQEYHIPIPPDEQEWHDREIIPQYIELGIQKIAFVVSEDDLITFLSLEQTFEEKKAKAIETQFFDSLEEARHFF